MVCDIGASLVERRAARTVNVKVVAGCGVAKRGHELGVVRGDAADAAAAPQRKESDPHFSNPCARIPAAARVTPSRTLIEGVHPKSHAPFAFEYR